MSRKIPRALVLSILTVAGLSYAGWRLVQTKKQEICYVCQRAAHVSTRTLGMEGGDEAVFCCPTCARSERQQSGRNVRLTELTDYHTEQRLDPKSAYLVENSDVNPCLHHRAHLDEHKQPLEARFDRCSPSVIAFARRDAAADFAREHGGQVLTFSQWWNNR